MWPMITPPTTGPTIWPSAETVVSVPNLLIRASELRLGHDALPADGCGHVPDAERGRRNRDGPESLGDNESEGRRGPDSQTESEQDRGMVPFGPPAEADREHDRRDSEASGRQPERRGVGAEGKESVGRHRTGQGDRDLEQEDACDGADQPRRR